jgi:hypothetical protein
MDVDLLWTFDEYQVYERARLNEALAEQERAHTDGLVIDPKSAPHGGYRIACVWPEHVTSEACALSAQLAKLLPGTPAYPYQAIHSSIGNISAPSGRLVDPVRNHGDRDLLDRLADAVEKALAVHPGEATDGRMVAFGPALLAPRMALVFGRPHPGYWACSHPAPTLTPWSSPGPAAATVSPSARGRCCRGTTSAGHTGAPWPAPAPTLPTSICTARTTFGTRSRPGWKTRASRPG